MTVEQGIRDLLGEIERREAQLLTWGLVDAGFTRAELESLAVEAQWQHAALLDFNRAEIVDGLVERGLIMKYSLDEQTLFRSRMAETVRLMSHLRQWMRDADWRAAPALVADMRFQIRPRMRPLRSLLPDEVLERLSGEVDVGQVRRSAVAAYLTQPDGSPVKLASFQYEGLATTLRAVERGGTTGVVVTAGTGSGKTHAFYLPAMVRVLEDIRQTPANHLRCLAIYPRQELLKDQLLTAVDAARRMGASAHPSPRPIRIGAWFRAVPTDETVIKRQWRNTGDGYVCPYLPCPTCRADLVWSERNAAAVALRCRGCSLEIKHAEFGLTRRHLQAMPPDFLFTTSESLNRQLASTYSRSLFGLEGPHRPMFCLLDEVHTYDGTHGAHVANLIRRWRNAVGSPMVFVGLSATLVNAEDFFAEMVGLPSSAVIRVEPAPEQLERTGDEYLLALRHNPTTGPQLLSLTIQASMLMSRMLDAKSTFRSQGTFGSKTFVFTDRLDSVNSLYWSILDAEGWYAPGRPVQRYSPRSLSSLRAPAPTPDPEREIAGQTWRLAQELGHDLAGDRQLDLGRTSSQDVGVSGDAQVVVATAALEVGFDDDEVGAVIQHKAPHDAARFLQRQGRAGRRPDMRPWTVVVLGDNGTDRLAYQNYDRLFAPELEPRMLFVSNTYVLKMQTLFATADWLAQRVSGKGQIWYDLAAPQGQGGRLSGRQTRARDLLQSVLSGGWARGDLERHLAKALQREAGALENALWSPPRALYLHALPTLLQRLETSWALEADGGHGDPTVGNFAPEFLPSQLYGELLVPEVRVEIPAYRGRGEPRPEVMAIEAALRELAPGNVTRRYAVADRTEMHWVPAPDATVSTIDLTALYTCLDDGTVASEAAALRCLRPIAVILQQTPDDVSEYNRGDLQWRFGVETAGTGARLEVPNGSWRRRLPTVMRHLHREARQVRVRRFAPSVDVATVTRQGRSVRQVDFVDSDGRPAALGFNLEVDALRMSALLPKSEVVQLLAEGAVLREHRWSYLIQRFDDSDGFDPSVTIFSRQWLRIALVAALLAEHAEGEPDLAAAAERLSGSALASALHDALDLMFNMDVNHGQQPGRSLQTVRDLLRDPHVLEVLAERARVLWGAPDAAAVAWLQKRLAATIAGLLLQAVITLQPQLEPDDVTVDLEQDGDDQVTVWLTETSPGSTGFLEALVQLWNRDASRLFDLMDAGGRSTDTQLADQQLLRILDAALLDQDPVAQAFSVVRASWHEGHAATTDATAELKAALTATGLRVRRPAFNTVASRLLAPGSSPTTDRLYRDFAAYWDHLSGSVGMDLDSRAAAFSASKSTEWDELSPGGPRTRHARYTYLNALLWARGPELARAAIDLPSRFGKLPAPAALALATLLGDSERVSVDLSATNWREAADAALRQGGRVELEAPAERGDLMRQAVLNLASQPTDCGIVLSYPRIAAVEAMGTTLSLRIYIPEMR